MISSLSSSNSLMTTLEANGLSAAKAKLVDADLTAAKTANSAALGAAASPTTSTAVRTILNAKIDADVASGKLSAKDAETVKKTLDDLDGQLSGAADSQSSTAADASEQAASSAATQGAPASGGAGGAGGAGGGTSSKTEASETVIVSGQMKTTIITYTDGTTATNTSIATSEDQSKYGKPAADAGAKSDVSQKYLSGITPGSLFNQKI